MCNLFLVRVGLSISLGFAAFTSPAFANGDILYVGAGHPYGTIGSAVSAASTGDLILVEQGTYPPFEVAGVNADKDLVILARQMGPGIPMPEVQSYPGSPAVYVDDVPAGGQLTLRGLHFKRADANTRVAVLSESEGEIWVEGCVFGTESDYNYFYTFGKPTLSSNLNESLHVIDCKLYGVNGTEQFEVESRYGSEAVSATDSNLSMWNSLLVGGNGGNGKYDPHGDIIVHPKDGSPAMVQVRQYGMSPVGLFFSGCTLRGGDGGDGDGVNGVGCVGGADGAYALVLESVNQAYSLDSIFEAGEGGAGFVGTPGCGSGMTPLTAIQLILSNLDFLAGPSRTATSVSTIVDGTAFELTTFGISGPNVRFLFSQTNPDYSFFLNRLGVLCVDPNWGQMVTGIFTGTPGANGSLSFTIPFSPILPGLGVDSASIWIQPVEIPTGNLGAPTCVSIVI